MEKITKYTPRAQLGLHGPEIEVDFEEDEYGEWVNVNDLLEIIEQNKGCAMEILELYL